MAKPKRGRSTATIDDHVGARIRERRIMLGLTQQQLAETQKAQADQTMTSALRGLFAVAENYPQLKANENFLKLQTRITELENEIADRREFYNDCVNTLNTRIQQFPDTFIAAFMSLQAKPMFKVEESDKAPVAMSFGAAH